MAFEQLVAEAAAKKEHGKKKGKDKKVDPHTAAAAATAADVPNVPKA